MGPMANASTTADLAHRLREASSEELAQLVREHVGEIDVAAAQQALANPFATREVIEALLALPPLLTSYEVRRLLALHPRTPEPRALRLVAGLFWRDLVRAGADIRLRPLVRRAAERALTERLPGLAAGEKMAIARRCGPGVMQKLRHDPSPRVVAALLENPRLTEGVLLPLLADEQAAPAVLEMVAANRRWGVRYDVRRALGRNPRTPVEVALRVLPHLKKNDLRQVARDARLAIPVRRRAALLAGEGP